MSGIHNRYKTLKWELPDSDCLVPDKAGTCVAAALIEYGTAYPPCVYTDDPMYDSKGDCLNLGCAYRFIALINRIDG